MPQLNKQAVMQSVLSNTDLRIGNLIFSKETQEVQKITGITEEHPFFNSITFDYPNWDEIEPIKLTEEWLVNFGLSKNNGYPYKFLNGFIKIRNGVYFYKYYHLDIELKYVHQLQNLYFSLTQTELTVA